MAWKSKTSSSQETNRFLLYSLQAMRIMMCKDERCGRVQWFLRKPVTQEVLIEQSTRHSGKPAPVDCAAKNAMKGQIEPISSLGSDCLAGGGEMGRLMRSMDWSKTAIGAVECWSPALRMMCGFFWRIVFRWFCGGVRSFASSTMTLFGRLWGRSIRVRWGSRRASAGRKSGKSSVLSLCAVQTGFEL
jgi:hypothetical protein